MEDKEKLKTLKEIEFLHSTIKSKRDFYEGEEDVLLTYSDDLRAEAVKWVKDCDRDKILKEELINEGFNYRQAFLNFFNLTEEDTEHERT